MLALWEELLAELDTLPVARGEGEAEVHDAVTLPIPDEPLSDDALLAHLRQIIGIQPTSAIHAFWRTSATRVPSPTRRLSYWRRG